ncbi:MAG: hypothetical protein ACUVRV_03195 [Cyanobacteriota bacterium]
MQTKDQPKGSLCLGSSRGAKPGPDPLVGKPMPAPARAPETSPAWLQGSDAGAQDQNRTEAGIPDKLQGDPDGFFQSL